MTSQIPVPRPLSESAPRPLEVLHVTDLSPSYRRVRFFAYHLLGAQLDPAPTVELAFPDGRLRPFTVVEFDAKAGELSIDFLLHGNGGSANTWASAAAAGQTLGVCGPSGQAARLPAGINKVVLAGDASALPTLTALAAHLEPHQVADIVVQVPSTADVHTFDSPAALNVEWLVATAAEPRPLPRALRKLPVDKVDHWWVACEATSARLVREHLAMERAVSEAQSQVTAYWSASTEEPAEGLL